MLSRATIAIDQREAWIERAFTEDRGFDGYAAGVWNMQAAFPQQQKEDLIGERPKRKSRIFS